jgi:hypothetical protein
MLVFQDWHDFGCQFIRDLRGMRQSPQRPTRLVPEVSPCVSSHSPGTRIRAGL